MGECITTSCVVHNYKCLFFGSLALNESSITGFVFCGVGHPWVDVLLRYRLAALAPSGMSQLTQHNLQFIDVLVLDMVHTFFFHVLFF